MLNLIQHLPIMKKAFFTFYNFIRISKKRKILNTCCFFTKFESKSCEMTKKYQNKYRIESARKKGYDYSQNGAYFITIVTKNRECFFGDIVGADDRRDAIHRVSTTMELSEIGKIAQKYWDEIPRHFPFIRLDEMVVMPNHIHGILWINWDLVGGRDGVLRGRDVACNVSTNTNKNEKMAKISPKRGSLASVIRSFKSAVTIKSREILPNFAWQSRFHDRIIRNENELNRIRKYIRENPAKWHRDRNNGDDLWL